MLFVMLAAGMSPAGGPVGSDLFLPLDGNRVYEYRSVMLRGGQEVVREKVRVTYYPADEFPGKNLILRRYDYFLELNTLSHQEKFYRYADQLFFDYLGQDQQGSYLYARQHQGERTRFILEQPEYLLKNPIQMNTAWQGKDGQYRIAGVNETVQTPAGTFRGCVRVDRARADNPIAFSWWYAPRVGLVKYQRTFPAGQETGLLLSHKK